MRAFRSGEGRPFTRLSDRASGALAIGGIGIFDESPGADFIVPDGIPRALSAYPDLAEVLTVNRGFARIGAASGLAPSLQSATGDVMVGRGSLMLAAAGRFVLRTLDGGDTFSVVPIAANGGGIGLLANFEGSTGWLGYVTGQSASSGSGIFYSNDDGASFAYRVFTWSNPSGFNEDFTYLNAPYRLALLKTSNGVHSIASPTSDPVFVPALPGTLKSIAANPSTGTIIYVYDSGGDYLVRRLSNLTGTPTAPAGIASFSAVDATFANGQWVLAAGGGAFVSRDDGLSFTYVAASGVSNLRKARYSNGIWVFTGGQGEIAVGNAGLTAITRRSLLPAGETSDVVGLAAAGGRWFTSGTDTGDFFRTLASDPDSEFVVPPLVPGGGLKAPKAYYMRAR